MAWQHIATAIGIILSLTAVDLGTDWFTRKTFDVLKQNIDGVVQRHSDLVEFTLRQQERVTELEKQVEVQRILVICAERPEVCEDN